MTIKGQFEENQSVCAVWEAMCPEAVDGTLTAAEQRAFDKHVAGCVHCQQELESAQRGAAWLQMLKSHTPEPPTTLMARILAETTGAANPSAAAVFVPEPDIWNTPRKTPGFFGSVYARVLDTFRVENTSVGFQPRFAMTAAMAFFSLALTLNLMGVRLRDVRAGNLRPTQLRRTVADAGASAERNFSNLRVVYQFESRVSDLRHDDVPEERESVRRPKSSSPDDAPKRPSSPHGSSDLMLPAVPASQPETTQGKV